MPRRLFLYVDSRPLVGRSLTILQQNNTLENIYHRELFKIEIVPPRPCPHLGVLDHAQA